MMVQNGCITQEALTKLQSYADMIDCECPNHLMAILDKVREFQAYTTDCIQRYPKDAATHQWLAGAARNIDALLSTTIVQLARMEGFIDHSNQFVPREEVKKQA